MAETERQKLEREQRAQEKADQSYYNYGMVGMSGAMIDHKRKELADTARQRMTAPEFADYHRRLAAGKQ